MDPAARFTDRVDDYVRCRPSYPAEIVAVLARCRDDDGPATIADVGSGSGKLSELFLAAGHRVLGVEPNDAMRRAAERLLSKHEGFRSVDGRAERTGLGEASVDAIVVGQAFHWFDPEPTRAEFRRVLRRRGPAMLVWNDRDESAGPFMERYEALLARHGTDYGRVNHQTMGAAPIERLFGRGGFERVNLRYRQRLDRSGLRGRLLSSSYAPAAGQPGHDAMLLDLDALFDRHERDGEIVFEYITRAYVGRLDHDGS